MGIEKNRKRIVLVVDDEPVNRHILGSILETEYEVVYAEDGQQAIEQIGAHGNLLSLVLLDLLMPNMDGYEVLEKLTTDDIMPRLPVIVLTSEKSAEVRSLEMGAADFLSKPYDTPEVILARVKHAIELAEDAHIIIATETDHLTGLYTREFFFEYVQQYDYLHPKMVMDAIVMDFNRFHLINELYGRAYGDKVLNAIADGIRDVIDEVGGIACRSDADTFLLYLGHYSNYDALTDKIIVKLKDYLKSTKLRIRMGIYSDIYRANTIEERFDRAREACNSLRNQYSASYAVYDIEMHEKEVFAARLLEDFSKAIKEKQFRVLYQPKYNIKGNEPVLSSAEALISWQHPSFGRVRPDAFIPLFEENGLIQKLDRYVWTEAAEQMARWKKTYDRVVPISVNVSRVDIYAPDICEYLIGLVKDNDIDPKDYLLEITESAYTDNSRQIVEVVRSLRDAGFRVEMDDFGSGYSSLNMLTALPIDALKLDMAFIRNIAIDNKEMRMVELVLEIAEFLEVPVIAEGVETKEQYELLKAAGCDIIQGYYFSRPIPAEDFAQLF